MRIGAFLVLMLTTGIAYAAGIEAFAGTWKLNESSGTDAAGAKTSSTQIYDKQ